MHHSTASPGNCCYYALQRMPSLEWQAWDGRTMQSIHCQSYTECKTSLSLPVNTIIPLAHALTKLGM